MAKYDVTFDYFHGYESEQFAFYRIPKVLFTDDYFRNLSSDAKVLYGLMLDRMALSMKNRWIDEENRVYIIFSLENQPGTPDTPNNTTSVNSPKTGDDTNIWLFVAAMVVSAGGMIVLLVKRKRK